MEEQHCAAASPRLSVPRGAFMPVVGAFGALWTVAYFMVATATHVARADWANVYLPVSFLVLAAILTGLRWKDAKPFRAALGIA